MVEDQIEGSNSNTVTNSRLDDRFSAGKEHSLKARKPYTITKQREKWTQEEHGKFLEALKLYGRSWRHIKDHVGNKTAIQIRSHAQKFFSKVVRASSGTDETEIGAIDIPPPRAKRKPTHPYPRKVSGPFEKRAGPVKSTCHDSSRLDHDILSPSWPECVLTQSLKLFGKTFFVTGSTKLPWNSMPNLAPVCTSICGLSGCVDLANQSSDLIVPMTQCFSQDGKNEVGNKGERYAKGFVPYKRCLEQDSSMSTGEDREELRVSLCL